MYQTLFILVFFRNCCIGWHYSCQTSWIQRSHCWRRNCTRLMRTFDGNKLKSKVHWCCS